MEQIEGKNYLTIPEVMERLNICRQTVLRYRVRKKLDFIKLRGKIYITKESYNNMFIPESEKSISGNQAERINKEKLQKFIDEFSSEECKKDRELIPPFNSMAAYKTIKMLNFETCQIICTFISKEANCSFKNDIIKKHILSLVNNQQKSMDNIKTGEVILFSQDNKSKDVRLNILIKLTFNDNCILIKEESFISKDWNN